MSSFFALANVKRLACFLFFSVFFAVRLTAGDPFALIAPTNSWKYNDESIDLGTAWIPAIYNDSTWSNGVAALGFRSLNNTNYTMPPPNTIRTLLRKVTPTNAALDIMTFYFRTHVNFTNNPGGLVLIASNLIDDGAIFYVNGREVGRLAMPEGTATWGTTATRNELITPSGVTHAYESFRIPVDALVPGDNVVAVEVHQGSPSSTSMAFQMELWAQYPNPTFLIITNQPDDVTVEEGTTLLIESGVSGDGGSYQWYRQGVGPVPGAIGETFYRASVLTNESGMYYYVVSNSVNSVTSRVFQLTVTIDLEGPILANANGSLTTTNVTVSFFDPVLVSTATNPANYKITNTLGGTLTVTQAIMANSTSVVLRTTTPRLPNNNYILIANNLRDTSVRNNLITPNSMIPISNLATNIVALNGGGWRYYDPYPPFDAPDLGTAWKFPGYVETNNWADGSGIFAFNQTPPGPTGTPLSQTPVPTTYFRLEVPNYQFGPGTSNLFLTHAIDDGAIIYLNGTEIYRMNMAAGTPNYQTVASATVGSATLMGPISVTGPVRQSGNLIAVELHQATASSDIDKVFGMRLDAYVLSVPVGPVIITGGPLDVTVTEGETATFAAMQVGGSSFQWQQNNVNVPGATDATYTTVPATLAMSNFQYRVTVSGASGSVTSTNARLRVIPDRAAPELLAGYASANSILLNFSERMGGSATVTGNYSVTNSAGATFTPTSATLQDGTNVVLSFASLPPATYFVVVNNVRDASAAGNLIAANSTIRTGFDSTVATYNSSWRYDQRGIDLTTQGWAGQAYNDAAWSGSGPGLLDGKAGGRAANTLPFSVGTAISEPTNGPSGRYLTNVYFRTHFNSYAAGTGTVTFTTVIDDGAVIYLNGVEIRRIRMNAGAVTYTTFANASVGDATVEGPFTATVTNLLLGDNVIAVEVHQNATGSSDVTWGGEFSVFVPSSIVFSNTPPPPPACTNIVWSLPTLRYQRVNGTNLTLSWTNPTTNTCGSNAVFTLQQALALSNNPAAIRWSNVTTVSPYSAIATNMRFFRLKL